MPLLPDSSFHPGVFLWLSGKDYFHEISPAVQESILLSIGSFLADYILHLISYAFTLFFLANVILPQPGTYQHYLLSCVAFQYYYATMMAKRFNNRHPTGFWGHTRLFIMFVAITSSDLATTKHRFLCIRGLHLLIYDLLPSYIEYFGMDDASMKIDNFENSRQSFIAYLAVTLFLTNLNLGLQVVHQTSIAMLPTTPGIGAMDFLSSPREHYLTLTAVAVISSTWSYIWDRERYIESFVYFWAPRLVSKPCQWAEDTFATQYSRLFSSSEIPTDTTQRRKEIWRIESLTPSYSLREFKYDKLLAETENANGSEKIRLLRLHKRGRFPGLVRATLETHLLQTVESLKYEALSYCWGEKTERRKTLILNNSLFRAPVATYDLLYARSSSRSDRLVWVDAICINQDDMEEKENQIQLMRRIYQNAERVIAWPGDTPSSRLAAAVSLDITRAQNPSHTAAIGHGRYWMERHSLSVPAFNSLIVKPYFSRVWIAQEIVVGKKVYIFHGGLYIPWERFIEVFVNWMGGPRTALLAVTFDASKTMDGHPMMATATRNILGLERLRALHIKDNTNETQGLISPALRAGRTGFFPLDELLVHCRSRLSTDPRDRIYALLGIALDETSQLIKPKYVKTHSDAELKTEAAKLYKTTTKALYGKGHGVPFHLLSCSGIGYSRKIPNLPSWVPDWTGESAHSNFTYLGFECADSLYKTALQYVSEFQFTIGHSGDHADLETLGIRGHLTDHIIQATTAPLKMNYTEEGIDIVNYFSIIENWHNEARKLVGEHIGSQQEKEIDDAIWRTLVGDVIALRRPAPSEFAKVYRAYLKLINLKIKASRRKPIASIDDIFETIEREHMMEEFPIEHLDAASMRHFGIQNFIACLSRSFAVTRVGDSEHGVFGLVPPMTKNGDIVVIFAGAPTPYLVRRKEGLGNPKSEVFELVGECYMSGLMDPVDCKEQMQMIALI